MLEVTVIKLVQSKVESSCSLVLNWVSVVEGKERGGLSENSVRSWVASSRPLHQDVILSAF